MGQKLKDHRLSCMDPHILGAADTQQRHLGASALASHILLPLAVTVSEMIEGKIIKIFMKRRFLCAPHKDKVQRAFKTGSDALRENILYFLSDFH